MPTLPTDNLYKFGTITGLLLLLVAMAGPLLLSKSLDDQLVQLAQESRHGWEDLLERNSKEWEQLRSKVLKEQEVTFKEVSVMSTESTRLALEAEKLTSRADLEIREVRKMESEIAALEESIKTAEPSKVQELKERRGRVAIEAEKVLSRSQATLAEGKKIQHELSLLEQQSNMRMKAAEGRHASFQLEADGIRERSAVGLRNNRDPFELRLSLLQSQQAIAGRGFKLAFILGVICLSLSTVAWYHRHQRHQDALLKAEREKAELEVLDLRLKCSTATPATRPSEIAAEKGQGSQPTGDRSTTPATVDHSPITSGGQFSTSARSKDKLDIDV
jgi:hypothetical protein